MSEEKKQCKHCNETKSVSEFFLVGEDEYMSICKECLKIEIQNYNKKHSEEKTLALENKE